MKKSLFSIIAILGVVLSIDAQCYLSAGTPLWARSKTTGVVELDNFLNKERSSLESFFGLKIDLYIGEENNAYFSPFCDLASCQGQVSIGKDLMAELSTKSYGLVRLQAVFAHEYAHAYQSRIKLIASGKLPELHADFLAGYYIASTKSITNQQFQSILHEFFSLGDNDFFSEDHHGTSEERSCAIAEGFLLGLKGNVNLYQASQMGLDYIKRSIICESFKYTNNYSPTPPAPKFEMLFVGNGEYDIYVYSSNNKMLGVIPAMGVLKLYEVGQGNNDFWFAKQKSNRFIKSTKVPLGISENNMIFKIVDVGSNGLVKYNHLMSADYIGYFQISTKVFKMDYRRIKDQKLVDEYFHYQNRLTTDFYGIGLTAFKEERFDDCITMMNKCLEDHPNDVNALFYKAVSKEQVGDSDEAILIFNFILDQKDKLQNPNFNLVEVYFCAIRSNLSSGNVDEAFELSNQALKYYPRQSCFYFCLETINFTRGEYNKSIETGTKALELMEKSPTAFDYFVKKSDVIYFRGLSYEKLGDPKKACTDFKAAKELGHPQAFPCD